MLNVLERYMDKVSPIRGHFLAAPGRKSLTSVLPSPGSWTSVKAASTWLKNGKERTGVNILLGELGENMKADFDASKELLSIVMTAMEQPGRRSLEGRLQPMD
ncbi:hypothetical protein BGX30_011691 [Mortierella sp. GBA39]|nr:hypothetical protein BGX30_011691 [Mortierella sp. GBA39]